MSRSKQGSLGEWVGILLGAFLVAMLIKTFVAETFYIPSASMEDTLLINDRIVTNKLAYKIGDIVTYKTKRYVNIQSHTSNPAWTPDVVLALWKPL